MRYWDGGMLDQLNIKVHPKGCPCCKSEELNIGTRDNCEGQGFNTTSLYIMCRRDYSCGLKLERKISNDRDPKYLAKELTEMIDQWNRLSFQERGLDNPDLDDGFER